MKGGLTCASCSTGKPATEFSAAQKRKGGSRRCKSCVAARADVPGLKCSSCDERKPGGAFSFNQKSKQELRRCKVCVKTTQKRGEALPHGVTQSFLDQFHAQLGALADSGDRARGVERKFDEEESESEEDESMYGFQRRGFSGGGMMGFSGAECDELLMQGVKPWDDDAMAVMAALNGGYDDYY